MQTFQWKQIVWGSLSCAAFAVAGGVSGRAQSPAVQQLYQKAHADQEAGRPEQAVVDYQELLRLDPSIAAAYNNLGRLLYNLSRFSDAAATLQKGLALDSSLVPAKIVLGASYLQLGQLQQALELLEAGVQALPADRFARITLARVLLGLNRPGEAAVQLEAITSSDSKDQEAWYLLGKVHLDLSREAFTRVQTIDPNTPLSHVMEGEIMESMQNTPGAVAAYKQAIAVGNAASSTAGNAVGADAAGAVGSPADGGEDAGALQHLASLYWSTGDWTHAREQYTVLLQHHPRDCVARWHLAKSMTELGEPVETGLRELNTALAQCPVLAEAHAERARLLLRAGSNGGARAGAGSGAGSSSRGSATANAEAALQDLLAAEKAAPGEPSVQQLLARCYRVLGEPAKSEAANRRFEQLQQLQHQAAERHASSVIQANQ